jgi:hypothetical protein
MSHTDGVGDHELRSRGDRDRLGCHPEDRQLAVVDVDGVAVVRLAEVGDPDRGRVADVDRRSVDRRVAGGDLGGANRLLGRHP